MSKDALSIEFELSAPFDLQGVQIPAREIVSNACPWEYTGASPDYSEHEKCGGCSWHREVNLKDTITQQQEMHQMEQNLQYM